MARNNISGTITNTSPYNFPVQFQAVHGSLSTELIPPSGSAQTNPPQPVMLPQNASPSSTLAFTNYAEGAGGELYIYACDGSQSWGILLFTPPNASNYFTYAYFGWPKEFQDVLNYLEGGGVTTYAPSSTVYGFPPPTGSGSGSELTILFQNTGSGVSAEASAAITVVPCSTSNA